MLAAGGIQASLRTKLETLGMKVFVVDPSTYDGVMPTSTDVGKLRASPSTAPTVVGTMKQRASRR